MTPPELMERSAPMSAGTLLLEGIHAEAPVSRHAGPRAEAAYLRARVEERRAQGDAAGEREASIALARLLASRVIELDRAAALAQRALSLGDDTMLRGELAGWLAWMGEPAMAAEALRGLCDSQRPSGMARTLVKIAVLLARADDVSGAVDALKDAERLDEADAMASELLGTISAWATGEGSPEAAAKAYLEAARRREGAREKEAAFEDRLRAFEIAPHDEATAEAMAAALAARGRPGAADEATRAHATALAARGELDRALAIHVRRLVKAVNEGDAARAVGCAFDALLEADVDEDDAAEIDEVLGQAGLYELVAARLELRAERQAGGLRSETYEALSRLYAGPLASPDRAVEAWIEAAASDPGNVAARAALREHAATLHDVAPLVEALIRIGEGTDGRARADTFERLEALRELAGLAEEKIADPGLTRWALETLREAGGGEDPAVGGQRAAARLRAQDEALASAQRALRGADTPEGRIDALRRLVVIYRGRPRERSVYEQALAALARALPADRGCLLALDRLSRRTGDGEVLEAVLEERLAEAERRATAEPPSPEHASAGSRLGSGDGSDVARAPALSRVELVRTRLLMSAIHRRQCDEARALTDVLPLLAEAPGHRGAASAALLLATRTGQTCERADALVQLAGPVWPALRAVLLALSAELYVAADEATVARRVAELACEADPACARAVATLGAVISAQAEGLEGAADRVGAAAIERTMTAVLPRGTLCDGLVRSLDAIGEPGLALAWTQRWLALRPGCPRATRELIRRAVEAHDAARLADAIAWVLAQPKPLGEMAPVLADALHALLELDSTRGLALARRTLDVFGPRIPLLRERLLELARRAVDPSLAVAVLERWRAGEPDAAEAVELLLMLADCRSEGGDLEGAARDLARAAEGGADPEEVSARIHRIYARLREGGAGFGSDGLIALTEARARALAARAGDAAMAASAWRELGSLLWDLAEDRRGAEQAFHRASDLAPSGGIERYARDLCEFAGVEGAIEALIGRALADRPGEDPGDDIGPPASTDRRRRAGLLIEAASLASEHNLAQRALVAAASAIEIDPSRADAVALVEKCAHVEGGVDVLDRTYRFLAQAALGCYGRRAAHYRAARQLERRGSVDLALSHAIGCFEAVPSEGTAYVLLARLSERAGDPSEAVSAIERVAATGDAEFRNGWLKRAAALAGKSEEGLRLRVDILLRALNVRPDPHTVEDVGEALREIIAVTGEADVEALRFDRAVKATLPKLDGPDGARAAIGMARIAVSVLDSPALALAAIERAMLADGDIDEFDGVVDLIPALARESERAQHLVAAIFAAAKKPHARVGPALLRWASKLAEALNVPSVAAALLVEAARRAPENDELAFEADVSVQVLGDETLRRSLDDALPVARRLEALLHLAERHERDGEDDQAALAFERALSTDALKGEARDRIVARLRRLFAVGEREADLEALLKAELARADLPDALRLPMARELAGLLSARDEPKGALEAVAAAALRLPFNEELLADVQRLARQSGSLRPYIDVLTRLVGASADDASRLFLLRQLAPLVQEFGDRAAAAAHYDAIARLDPIDLRALEALEQDATDRGDHAALASILARRIFAAAPETRRALQLRRAAVLEQRLGLLDEACVELGVLLESSPEDVSALRFLADIHERLGAPLRAAPLWRTLGDLAAGPEEKAEYSLRACKAYLDGGELDAAAELLDASAQLTSSEGVMELRVEIARCRGDARALADALELLAASTQLMPERRAALLLEAARTSSTLGEDDTAIEQARRAVQLAPDSLGAVLEARRLEYRLRGTGTPRVAQAVVDDLNRIAPRLGPEHIELHAFLLAESLDVIQGHGAGMRELTRRHAEVGPATLIALGMAERLALKRNFDAAVPLFERALGGNLQGMRARGRVALAAAQAAQLADDLDTAGRLLEEAAAEPETRALAVRRQLELTAARGEPEAARRALEALVDQTSGLDRGRMLAQLARLLSAADPDKARALLAEAWSLAGSDRALNAQIVEIRHLIELLSTAVPSAPPERLSARPPSVEPPPLPASAPPPPPLPASRAALSSSASAAVTPPAPAVTRRPPPLPAHGRAASPHLPAFVRPVAPPIAPATATPQPAHAALPRLDAPRARVSLELDLGELSDTLEEAPTPTPVAPIARLDENLLDAAPAESRLVPSTAPPPAPLTPAPRSGDATPASVSVPPPLFYPPTSVAQLLSSPPPSSASHEEASLFRDLAAGDYEAGERLIQLFSVCGEDRSREALAVRRMQAALRLGDRSAIERLHAAAVVDKNLVYARALEHVLHAFDPVLGATAGGHSPIAPPPLSAQRNAPDLVNALLFRDLDGAVNEALAMVWDTGLYRREAAQYGLTGVERVQPGPATVVGEVYGVVGGHLGFLRTALFHQRTPGALQGQSVQLLPPAVLLRGEVREETAELRYIMGSHLTGALPEHVLVNGLPTEDLRTLLAAVVAAFGPLDGAPNQRGNAAVVRLEQNLWQLIPPRCERRIREICQGAERMTYEAAVRTTRAAMRRAGLYASGDLGTAVRMVVKELGIRPQVPLAEPNGLAAACVAHPEISDLVRLATRMEYAEARWQPGPVTSLRRIDSLRPKYRAS